MFLIKNNKEKRIISKNKVIKIGSYIRVRDVNNALKTSGYIGIVLDLKLDGDNNILIKSKWGELEDDKRIFHKYEFDLVEKEPYITTISLNESQIDKIQVFDFGNKVEEKSRTSIVLEKLNNGIIKCFKENNTKEEQCFSLNEGVSRCSKKDNFDEAFGGVLALYRLYKGNNANHTQLLTHFSNKELFNELYRRELDNKK